jgi:hypothetical protein
VNVLSDLHGDIRTVDKLVNGKNRTRDESNMWLAPFVSKQQYLSDKKLRYKKHNTLIISFEKMITLASINL